MRDPHRLPVLPVEPRAPGPAAPSGATPPEGSGTSCDESHLSSDWMKVGDLARDAGKTVRAVHLYEELGLLTPVARSKGGYRLYAAEALVRIRWIGKLQEIGFSLGDIRTIVREWEHVASAPSAMKRMREVYARKLDETREQRRRLEALEHELSASLSYLDTCDDCDPQRLLSACPSCDLHDPDARVPELVLGFRAH